MSIHYHLNRGQTRAAAGLPGSFKGKKWRDSQAGLVLAAFPSEKSPIIIDIVGPDPFGPALEETVRGEKIQGHPLAVEHYARIADIKTCHILFIPQPEIRHTDKIIKGKPVLTVADSDSTVAAPAITRFVVENNKVHFHINAEAARAANISLSSKLLRVTDATPGGGPLP